MAPEVKPQVRAGCYCRISSDPEDKREGTQRQREDTAVMCEVNGWTPVGYYVDDDKSASNGQARPDWDRLLADIKAGKIDAVVVWNQDRGWRKMADLEDLRPLFASRGVKLATTNIGNIDFNNPDDVFRAQVSTALSEMEIAKMRVRQLRAARQRAQQGRPQWKKAFGYKPDTRTKGEDDGTRLIDRRQQRLVKAAYKAIVRGEEITAIAKAWNAAGVKGVNDKPWSPSTLSLFLRAPRNAGLRAHNDQIVMDEDGQPVKGMWEPLVDEELWRSAQAVLKRNEHGPKSVRKHQLTGVMRCGREGCNGRLAGNWVKQATGGAPGRPRAGEVKQPSGQVSHAIAYACKACHRVSVRAEHIEPLIIGALIKRLSRPDAVKLLRRKVYDPEEAEKLNAEEAILLGRLSEIAVERAKGLIDGVGYHRMTEIINADLAEIETRRQDQVKRRALDDIPLGTPDVADKVRGLSPDRLRKVIDVLMVITVAPVGKGGHTFHPDRVSLEWK